MRPTIYIPDQYREVKTDNDGHIDYAKAGEYTRQAREQAEQFELPKYLELLPTSTRNKDRKWLSIQADKFWGIII